MVLTADADDELLLALLNSTPSGDGGFVDLLDDGWSRTWSGTGSAAEVADLRRVRDVLQSVVRGTEPATALTPALEGVRLLPDVGDTGIDWRLDVDDDHRLAARAVLAWGRLQEQLPGRLRACANDECRLYLLDRSRPNSARWCSMKVCGNRLKARRHYERERQGRSM
jgi:predicted RNA-binding Zn ribbon-like protein